MKDKNRKNPFGDWEAGMWLREKFMNMFGDNTPEGERRFIRFGKKALFAVVVLVELLIFSQYLVNWIQGGSWVAFVVALCAGVLLTAAEIVSLFVLQDETHRFLLYVLQALAVSGILALAEGAYSLFLYILILTQLYLDAQNGRVARGILISSLVLYAVSYGLQVYLSYGGTLNLFEILRESLGSLGLLVLHFLIVQFLLTFYRQYLKLNRALAELDASKKELEKAYAVVAEVSVLEERQRIAKELHDTAGHSLTTVIMQTESAKRIIGENPEEAKNKIIAANLQAKTTLERLRESVHLLSGTAEGATLKTALEGIIHESTDGTEIRIRSEIEELLLSPAKHRFLCNALREGISNGLRHGNATAFWVELKAADGKIKFVLSDNGAGFGQGEWQEGFGLKSMKERARAFGGEAEFISEPEEGFEIRISLPADN